MLRWALDAAHEASVTATYCSREKSRVAAFRHRHRRGPVPVKPAVATACALPGLDRLNVANERKQVAVVDADAVDAQPAAMRAHPLGRDAVHIGRVAAHGKCFVQMATSSC